MTRISLIAALGAIAATPVLAEMADMSDLIRSRDITGGAVLTMGAEYDEATWADRETFAAAEVEYDQIGEIEDIVLDSSGQMVGIVAEIGGFLDIGDKHVMIPLDDLRLQPVDDQEYQYITRLSEEQLEELPGVDEGWFD